MIILNKFQKVSGLIFPSFDSDWVQWQVLRMIPQTWPDYRELWISLLLVTKEPKCFSLGQNNNNDVISNTDTTTKLINSVITLLRANNKYYYLFLRNSTWHNYSKGLHNNISEIPLSLLLLRIYCETLNNNLPNEHNKFVILTFAHSRELCLGIPRLL